jgi:hypothetical protein
MAKNESVQQESKQTQAQTRYWIGIAGPVTAPALRDGEMPSRDRLPFERITCGGMDFCRWSEDVSVGPDGVTKRSERIGRVVPMNSRQVAAIKAAAKHKVVRQVGHVGQIHDSRDARYTEEPGDASLGTFLYCYEAGLHARDEVPEANLA